MNVEEINFIDSKKRKWHIFERPDASIIIYTTTIDHPAHFIVYDELDRKCLSCGQLTDVGSICDDNQLETKIQQMGEAYQSLMGKVKIGNLEAIAYHLEQGEDNGGISREALAIFLRSIVAEINHPTK